MIKYLTYEELENARIMYQNFLNGTGPNPFEFTFEESTSGDYFVKRKLGQRINFVLEYFELMHWLGIICNPNHIGQNIAKIEFVDRCGPPTIDYAPKILPPIPIEYDQIPIGSEIYIPGYKNAW